jgi:CheY-like chemotaxis protein
VHSIFFAHDQQEDPEARKKALEEAGYQVTLFENGEKMIAQLESELPALILMDILLQGPTGFDVCRRVRSLLDAGQMPIVLGSRIYRSRVYREEAAAAGAQRYIRYPVDLEEMVDVVREVIATSPRSFAT